MMGRWCGTNCRVIGSLPDRSPACSAVSGRRSDTRDLQSSSGGYEAVILSRRRVICMCSMTCATGVQGTLRRVRVRHPSTVATRTGRSKVLRDPRSVRPQHCYLGAWLAPPPPPPPQKTYGPGRAASSCPGGGRIKVGHDRGQNSMLRATGMYRKSSNCSGGNKQRGGDWRKSLGEDFRTLIIFD